MPSFEFQISSTQSFLRKLPVFEYERNVVRGTTSTTDYITVKELVKLFKIFIFYTQDLGTKNSYYTQFSVALEAN